MSKVKVSEHFGITRTFTGGDRLDTPYGRAMLAQVDWFTYAIILLDDGNRISPPVKFDHHDLTLDDLRKIGLKYIPKSKHVSIGTRFWNESDDELILVCVDPRNVGLVGFKTGGFVAGPLRVGDCAAITLEELQSLGVENNWMMEVRQ